MTEKDYSDCIEKWYAQKSGICALRCTLLLMRKMLSLWSRRGHRILQIGFEHPQIAETLWESGLDVSAVATAPYELERLPSALSAKVTMHQAALDCLPFADNQFDYVLLMLPPRLAPYPPLSNIIQEAIRVTAKKLLFHSWNRFSLTGLRQRLLPRTLPEYLQYANWYSCRNVNSIIKKIVPTAKIQTNSILMSPLHTWEWSTNFLSEQEKKSNYINIISQNINNTVLPMPIGALMQISVHLTEEIPLTGIPLTVPTLEIQSFKTPSVQTRTLRNTKKDI